MLEAIAEVSRHGIAFDPLPTENTPTVIDLDPGSRLKVPLWQYFRNVPLRANSMSGHCFETGEVIAEPLDRHGVCVHAPVAGRRAGVCEVRIASGDRQSSAAVEIVREGESSGYGNGLPGHLTSSVPRRLSLGGIRGLGGAGFPTHLKLEGKFPTTLVVNLMESDPEIKCDRSLFASLGMNHALCVVKETAELLGVANVIIVFPSTSPLTKDIYRAAPSKGIMWIVLPNAYALGNSDLLMRAVRNNPSFDSGREDGGTVVLNFQTVCAIRDLLAEGKPMLSRLVTAVDSGANRTVVFRAYFGTPLRRIVQGMGVDADRAEIRCGGISSERPLDPDDVVGATTNSVVIRSAAPVRMRQSACIGCGWCDSSCPAGIHPQRLLSLARSGRNETAVSEGLLDCVLCKTCDWVCPSGISVADELRGAITVSKRAQSMRQRRLKALERKERKQAAIRADMRYASSIDSGGEETTITRLIEEVLDETSGSSQSSSRQ